MEPSVDPLDLLKSLVAIPSVNPMGRDLQGPELLETRVSAYLEAFFRQLGVPCTRQQVAPGRDNIVARLDSPGAAKTILFEVHQDTVPVDGMTIDPFAGEVRGGKLFGRGACDVKGGMTAMLAAFARLEIGRRGRKPEIVVAVMVRQRERIGQGAAERGDAGA